MIGSLKVMAVDIELIVIICISTVLLIIVAILIIVFALKYKKDRQIAHLNSKRAEILYKAAMRDAKDKNRKIVVVRRKRPYVVGYGKKDNITEPVSDTSDDNSVV
jgi:hypothetical protein